MFKLHVRLGRLVVNDVSRLATRFTARVLRIVDAHAVHNLKGKVPNREAELKGKMRLTDFANSRMRM